MAKPMASYMIWKVENKYDLDLGNWVGPLGLAGMTAWVSFQCFTQPRLLLWCSQPANKNLT